MEVPRRGEKRRRKEALDALKLKANHFSGKVQVCEQ